MILNIRLRPTLTESLVEFGLLRDAITDAHRCHGTTPQFQERKKERQAFLHLQFTLDCLRIKMRPRIFFIDFIYHWKYHNTNCLYYPSSLPVRFLQRHDLSCPTCLIRPALCPNCLMRPVFYSTHQTYPTCFMQPFKPTCLMRLLVSIRPVLSDLSLPNLVYVTCLMRPSQRWVPHPQRSLHGESGGKIAFNSAVGFWRSSHKFDRLGSIKRPFLFFLFHHHLFFFFFFSKPRLVEFLQLTTKHQRRFLSMSISFFFSYFSLSLSLSVAHFSLFYFLSVWFFMSNSRRNATIFLLY